ncbi:hypothetical protein OROMI_004321 [Orobanche minor]
MVEYLEYVLKADISLNLVCTKGNQEEIDVHEKWVKDDVLVRGFMMGSMINDLHRARDKMTSARMKEGQKVADHVLQMFSMIERANEKQVTAQSNIKTKPREAALVISYGPRKSKNQKKRTNEQYKPNKGVQEGKGKARKVQKAGRTKHTDRFLECDELGHWRRTCPKVNGASDLDRSRQLGAG